MKVPQGSSGPFPKSSGLLHPEVTCKIFHTSTGCRGPIRMLAGHDGQEASESWLRAKVLDTQAAPERREKVADAGLCYCDATISV